MRVWVVDDDKPRKGLEAERCAVHVAGDGEDRRAASRAGEAVSNLDPSERNRMVIEQLPEVRYIARRSTTACHPTWPSRIWCTREFWD